MYLLRSAIYSSRVLESVISCSAYPLNASLDLVQMLGADERFTLSNSLQTFSYAYDGSLVSSKTIGATTQGAPNMPSQSFNINGDNVRFLAEIEIDSVPTGTALPTTNTLQLFVLDMSLNDNLSINLQYDESPTGLAGSAWRLDSTPNGISENYYLQTGSKVGIYYVKSENKYGFVISGFDSSGDVKVGDLGYSSNSLSAYDFSEVFIAVQANEDDTSGLSGTVEATLTIDGSEAMSGYPGGAVDNCGNLLESSLQFDINYASGYFYADGSERTLSEVMDYTRPDPCWVVDSDYVLHEFAANEVPVVSKQGDGYIPFGEATNLLLNSDAPATQTVTVTDATAYTLSVWSQDGTGSAEVTTGGTGTATGNWRDQNHLTFTSSGTSVEVTVSGNVDYIQLEEGDNSTEYIKTGASAVTRSMFTESAATTLLTALLNGSEGTFVIEAQTGRATSSAGYAMQVREAAGGVDDSIRHYYTRPDLNRFRIDSLKAGALNDAATINAPNSGLHRFTLSYQAGEFKAYLNGALVETSTSFSALTTLDTMGIGYRDDIGTTTLNGRIARIVGYNTANAAT